MLEFDIRSRDRHCRATGEDLRPGEIVYSALVPQNDGSDCGEHEGDVCVLSSVCASGACLVTPLCDEHCERCDPAGCASLCGNPWGSASDNVNSTDALFALRAAVEQLELAQKSADADFYIASAIDSRLRELRQRLQQTRSLWTCFARQTDFLPSSVS